jgi:CheY-like chemotaxis protein
VELTCNKQKETAKKVHLKFTIKDTGVGIPKDKVKIIFEQFRQADSAVTKKYGGTGLGLTISKRLVEMQQGSIDVKSKVGIGTSFSVDLPYLKGDEKAYVKKDFKKDERKFYGTKALVVDDDSVNRLLGHTILTGLGFEVDMAASGAEAIDILNVKRYDVVVLDIHMPVLSGIDVANFLRQTKHERHTKILAVTAAFQKEDIHKYKAIGIDDYLIKPFRENKLYNKMCRLLGFDIQAMSTMNKKQFDKKKEGYDGLYDLSELRSMANNDVDFLISMLDTFIDNLSDGLEKMVMNVNNKDWKDVGELAHKLKPSFEHLRVSKAVDLVKELEEKTLYNPDIDKATAIFNEVLKISEELKHQLKLEKEKIASSQKRQ